MGHGTAASRTQDTMRPLSEDVQAGEAVADALLRPMPQDGIRAHGCRTRKSTEAGATVSQTVTETGNTMSDAEQQRSLVDEMIRSRIASSGETEADAIQHILAQVASLPDDASMIVKPDGTTVNVRTIRVWASFYSTPEKTQ